MPNLPPIPDVPVVDLELYDFLTAVKEVIEVREGIRGEVEDQFVSYGELLDPSTISKLGITGATDTSSDDPVTPGGTDPRFTNTDPPSAPSNLSVEATAWVHRLTWTNPADDHVAGIEVYHANVDDWSGSAERIAIVTVPGNSYEHNYDSVTKNHYYWIRAVSYAGNFSDVVPDPDTLGGDLIPARESTDQAIDAAISTLQGADATLYDSEYVYAAGDRARWTDEYSIARTFERRDYDIGNSDVDPSNAMYWKQISILAEGDVDGEPTIGLDGNLVVDDTILARHIRANQIDGGHIKASAEITLQEGGKATFGDSNVIIDTDSGDGVNGRIIVAPNGGVAGNNYCELTDGDINFYRYIAGDHRLTRALRSFASGTAVNGATVSLDTHYWATIPNVFVLPLDMPTYKDGFVGDQRLDCSRSDPVEYEAGHYSFVPSIQLVSSGGNFINAINETTSLTSVGAAWSVQHETPDGTTALTAAGYLSGYLRWYNQQYSSYQTANSRVRLRIYVDGAATTLYDSTTQTHSYNFSRAFTGLTSGVHTVRFYLEVIATYYPGTSTPVTTTQGSVSLRWDTLSGSATGLTTLLEGTCSWFAFESV